MPNEFHHIKLKTPQIYGIFIDYIVSNEYAKELGNMRPSNILRFFKAIGIHVDKAEKEKVRY
jgi:hypothetical protein